MVPRPNDVANWEFVTGFLAPEGKVLLCWAGLMPMPPFSSVCVARVWLEASSI